MKSTIAKEGDNKRLVEVEVSEKELTPHFDAVYEKYQKSVRLEGFRKGKVPLGLIKKLYGEHIRHEAIEEVVQSVFKEVTVQERLRPVAPAKLEDIDYEPGVGLRFKAAVEIVPEIEIRHYSKLSVESEVYQLDEEDITRALDDVREQMAIMQPIEGRAEENHYILADFQKIDKTGVPIIGEKFEDRFFQLNGDGNKDITDRLIGVRAGETRKVELPTLVESAANEAQNEIYEIKVKEIKSKQLPDLDDELAKDAGDFETLDELKADIQKRLTRQTQYNARKNMRQRLIDEVLKKNAFDLPETMIESYLDALVEGTRNEADEKLDEEAFKNEYRVTAIWNLKWELVKEKIALQENIKVDEQDKEDFIARIVEERGLDEKQLRASLKNKKAHKRLEDDALESKVLDLLEKNAKIKENKITKKDFDRARQIAKMT